MSDVEAKLKHLDFIQAAIGRMATNSFLYKGWAITLAGALTAVGAVNSKRALLLTAVVSTVMFWSLDGYYLWLERGFIRLHEVVSAKEEADIDFCMRIDKSKAVRNWLRTCLRHHLLLFYGVLVFADVLGIYLIGRK